MGGLEPAFVAAAAAAVGVPDLALGPPAAAVGGLGGAVLTGVVVGAALAGVVCGAALTGVFRGTSLKCAFRCVILTGVVGGLTGAVRCGAAVPPAADNALLAPAARFAQTLGDRAAATAAPFEAGLGLWPVRRGGAPFFLFDCTLTTRPEHKQVSEYLLSVVCSRDFLKQNNL